MANREFPNIADLTATTGGSVRLASNFFVNAARLLAANVGELRQHLVRADEPFIPDADAYIEETQRLTFNALMASLSLRDLSYRVLNVPAIASSDLPASNKQQVAVFTRPRLGLVGELRDHVAHRGLPPILLRTTMEMRGGFQYSLLLARGPLIRDKKVSGAVRQYLEGLQEDVEFRPLVEEYFGAQWAWAIWFHKELSTGFVRELAELDAVLAPWTLPTN